MHLCPHGYTFFFGMSRPGFFRLVIGGPASDSLLFDRWLTNATMPFIVSPDLW
jgi:hypothetical protein